MSGKQARCTPGGVTYLDSYPSINKGGCQSSLTMILHGVILCDPPPGLLIDNMLYIILLSALTFWAQCTSVGAASDQEPPLSELAVQELQHRLTTLDQQVGRRSIPDVFLPITIDVHYHIDSKENITVCIRLVHSF